MKTLRNPLLWLTLGALLLCGALVNSGCVALQPGADPLVVRAEQAQTMAEGTFDLIINLDHLDRGFWRTNAPAFHGFVEQLRFKVPVYNVAGRTNLPRYIAAQWQLDRAKLDYVAARNYATSNTLAAALASLQALSDQTTAWLTIVTNRP